MARWGIDAATRKVAIDRLAAAKLGETVRLDSGHEIRFSREGGVSISRPGTAAPQRANVRAYSSAPGRSAAVVVRIDNSPFCADNTRNKRGAVSVRPPIVGLGCQ